MAKKEELFEKETRYCKIIKSVDIVDNDETFALEKIYIKSLDRYEIRLCLYKDCRDRLRKLIPRSTDIKENLFRDLILLGIKSGVLGKEFLEGIK
ncbi:hypothetical protein ACWJU0_11120 [Clostridioides difficile]|uniref:hypothetical protein n=1 Tax=Clostridioides difficile TaxID=1496 RepID=UPI000826FBCE|nr:hypothetical protein [Clostridioides difficile]HBG7256469.1 hypothetical protein [Clostridioides difficile]